MESHDGLFQGETIKYSAFATLSFLASCPFRILALFPGVYCGKTGVRLDIFRPRPLLAVTV